MPFAIQELQNAYKAYQEFLVRKPPAHHARYIFPFFTGSYFTYRKLDVERVAAIAMSISNSPTYVDVGCGYGDMLEKVRGYLPNATGIEKEGGIFYAFGVIKPDYIRLMPVEGFSESIDVAFVGWMEPGQDFRDPVARCTDVIVTTLDQGISLAAEFDGHGFQKVAWWRTPSWEDVNTEIMNRYYTKIPEGKQVELAKMRGAHNFWYVYARPAKADIVKEALRKQIEKEPSDSYDFESALDECGYGYLQKLENPSAPELMWHVQFN